MNKIEILSPAGSMDSVIAAVRSGADAIYVGAKRFSARSGAHNFDENELRECVRYCHLRDVKVYLALNTLIFDDEMHDALELAKSAARADIDAIILQDIGLVSLIKKAIPELPLHASTQMSVHTPGGAQALYEAGFKRVVLARELSLAEIGEIHDSCSGIELEVFVHGALCMCVSGQCYFSAMLGGRSANRGMCAQPCRLPMQYGDNDHALSLKDNGGLQHIAALEQIGVASAKIEGRMKRPEYVAAATAAVAEAREGNISKEQQRAKAQAVFSRSGFTDGYLRGERGSEMFGYRRKEDVVAADNRLLKDIRNDYKDEPKKVPLDMTLRVAAGENPVLTVSDGKRAVTVEGDAPAEKAIKLPLDDGRAAQSLSKTGGTPYILRELCTEIGENTALSASALNALRRGALEKLTKEREKPRHCYTINDFDIENELDEETTLHGDDWICTRDTALPEELKHDRRVFIAMEKLTDPEQIRALSESSCVIGVELPRVYFGKEAEYRERLRTLRERGVSFALVHSIDAAHLCRALGFTICAGFGMNLANSWSLSRAKQYGIEAAEVSVELDMKRIGQLKKCIPVGIIKYGYFPLMISRNVPAGRDESCKTEQFLQDRKHEKFRVISHDDYAEILNCVPIFMPQEKYNEDKRIFHIIRFTVENSVDNKEKILEKIRENRGFERFTHGLYHRGVK